MDLIDPAIGFVGLARSLGIEADRAVKVAGACDLIRTGLAKNLPTLIEVDIERSFAPA